MGAGNRRTGAHSWIDAPTSSRIELQPTHGTGGLTRAITRAGAATFYERRYFELLRRAIFGRQCDGERAMSKSLSVMVAAAIALCSFVAIQSAKARAYRWPCGHPQYGYLPPNPDGGSHTPRVVFVPVVVYCAYHPYVVWKHCSVTGCR